MKCTVDQGIRLPDPIPVIDDLCPLLHFLISSSWIVSHRNTFIDVSSYFARIEVNPK